MPITLGILAQSRQAPAAAGSFDLLETYLVPSGGVASVSFTNLNATYGSTYKHLQLRIVGRTTRLDERNGAKIRFNGGANTDYSYHHLIGNGSTVGSFGDAGPTYFFIPIVAYTSANSPANSFGATITDVLDAFSTTKTKTMRTLLGKATGDVGISSAAWYDTAAINSMVIEPDITSNWVEHSRFSLYGVK